MKLSNFVLKKTKGSTPLDLRYYADVDVTTGSLFWKNTKTRQITREYATHWYFTDDGKYTPEYQAEELERAWKSTQEN